MSQLPVPPLQIKIFADGADRAGMLEMPLLGAGTGGGEAHRGCIFGNST